MKMKYYKFFSEKITVKTFFIATIFMFAVNESEAQVQVPFKQRTSVYSPDKKIYNIRGDFQMIGNTNMTLKSYTNTASNGYTDMIYVDIDGDPNTINSSSATLAFSTENGANPDCSNVIYAGLYWTGRAHDDANNTEGSPNPFLVPDGSHYEMGNGVIFGGYTLSISQTGSGTTSNPRYATYVFTPIGGGDAVTFRYNTWLPFMSTWQSTLTVQVGSGSQISITDYAEDQSGISIVTFPTPYLINTGETPVFIYSLKKNRASNTLNISDFSANVVSSTKLVDKRQVKIKHASATAYQTITASAGDIHYPINTDGFMYSGYAEVTDYVKRYGLGSYTVADIALREGNGCSTGFFGGWGMVVIYENSKMKWRDVTVFDGYAYVAGATTVSHQLPVSGFNTAQSGNVQMKLGIIAGEGDYNISGDYFEIRPQSNPGTWTRLSHTNNTTNNFFNSSIQTGGNARNPNLQNNSGMDIAMFNVPNSNNSVITNNQKSTTFRYGSTQDTYIISCIAMAVDAYVPAIETSNEVTGINDITYSGGAVLPGDEISIEMEVRNKGSEGVNNLEYVMPIPYTTTFIEASATYEQGLSGTVTYDPTRGATGAIIWNVGQVPLLSNKDLELAKLTYKLRVTTDCYILSNALCPPSVINEGIYFGIGAISGIFFSDNRFVLGYKEIPCEDEPIYGIRSTQIDRDAFVTANCNGGSYSNRTFYYCDDSGAILPFDDLSNYFPVGTRFYDDIDFIVDPDIPLFTNIVVPSETANEYTAASGFPKISGATYYAIPPGSKNTCYWEFDIVYLHSPEIIVADTAFCSGDEINLQDIITIQGMNGSAYDSEIEYTVTFYNNAEGTEIISPIVSPDATRSYWVKIQIDNSLCASVIEEIVVAVGCFFAIDDYATTFGSVKIDVLANDILSTCERGSSLEADIVTASGKGPSHGIVNFNSDSTITYTVTGNYIGLDTFYYYIKCGTSIDTAAVCVNIIVKPDNIDDADCYVEPPVTKWDIERKRLSSVPVHYLATPLVGDLDRDGRVEVVTAGVSTNFVSSDVLIFNDSLQLIRKINLQYGTPQHFTTNLLIADVDKDGFGDIVVGTVNNTLLCYSHLGEKKWGPTQAYSAESVSGVHYCPSLIISDINGDGYAEILAVDKIYDAATGILLVTLPPGGRGFSSAGPESYMPVFADIDNDGIQEVVAGNTVYKVSLNRTNPTQSNARVFSQMPPDIFPDGFTSVADIDMDGDLDVIVTAGVGESNHQAMMYVWDGATATQIGNTITVSSTDDRISRAFAGDITGNGRPDIAFTYTFRIVAYGYNSSANNFTTIFSEPTTDASGATTMSMFDFNQDGEVELVYRDMEKLRIINKSGKDTASFESYSGTHTEYPVIVDLDKDGHADILVTGALYHADGAVYEKNSYIMHFGSKTPNQWASARSVWNQHAYNAVNVNKDLTIPRVQLNPATVFPGADGQMNTPDDVYPYNNFLQQQTLLNEDGMPLWVTPDAMINATTSSMTVSGNDLIINACFTNVGDAPIGSPVFVTLYNNEISSGNELLMDSVNIQAGVGEQGCVTFTIPDAAGMTTLSTIIVRVNDRSNVFPYQLECDISNNVTSFVNPFLMRKNSTLLISPSFVHNGTYPNPVSVLYNEEIEYKITAVNATLSSSTIIITDTIPAHLRYVPGTAIGTDGAVSVNETMVNSDNSLIWTFTGVPSQASRTAIFKATPVSGAVASQPLFINHAWVKLDDLAQIPTNSTYHQGAGVSIMTFSAGLGGNIYNAVEQALDYMTTPSPGIIIAPDEGYNFAGWSHGDYVSLRGKKVEAREGIIHYDTLTVYGNIELHAHFELEEYPVRYYLNGSENAKTNPSVYTIKSGMLTLEAPEKTGDTFTGWTGSNGEKPQLSVVITSGSTGELTFYANFLHSGREDVDPESPDTGDKVWALKDDLYIKTSKAGSLVRIYSPDGILRQQHTIVAPGLTTKNLPRGIYIVTINNSIGEKIRIE